MKKWLSFLCALLLISVTVTPIHASETNVKLYSEYAYLFDQNTSLEYINKKGEEKIYPASMTKILTTALALEKITDMKEQVTVDKKDLAGLLALQATTAGFNPGEKVTYEDLLYGALLPSGADACNTLARLTYGDVDTFIQGMNDKIKELGLKNTKFVNVTGLHDENHYTTAKDMAMILKYALKNKNFKKMFETRKYTDSKGKRTWVSSLERAKQLKNIESSHITGAKSGYTDEAQLTLASTMSYEGHDFILVTAKADGQKSQNNVKDASTVYDYLTKNFKKFIIYKKEETIHTYYIFKNFEGFYDLNTNKDISMIVSNDVNTNNIDVSYDGKTILNAPIQKNDKLGIVKVLYEDETLYEYNVYLEKDIESSIFAIVIHYFIIAVIIILVLLFGSRKVYRIIRRKKKKKN